MIRFGRQAHAWLMLGLLALLTGCPPGGPEATGPITGPPREPALGPPLRTVAHEPELRVRIGEGVERIEVASSGGSLRIGPSVNMDGGQVFVSPVTITRKGNDFILVGGDRTAYSWAAATLSVQATSGATLSVGGTPYPGRLAIHPAAAGGRFDIISHVGLESYLPGVLDRELYRSWAPEMFKAQAVAARSYALFSARLNAARLFDVEATTDSQVYGGAGSSKSTEAVAATRGMVLTYGDRVLPAYFSAATGGTGQDAAIAFPNGADLAPLRGRYQGGWDAACRYYRWGPFTRQRTELARRIAQWGKANRHTVASLGSIERIEVSLRNAAGRPARFTITDRHGGRYVLAAEHFRFACNQDAPGLSPTPESARLMSSHVTVSVQGDLVHFTDGRGHGHGVGLSQWGAQAMAAQGYDFASILAFYYPGAALEKAY